jgi:ribose 1,5-bisphosphate isomerase
MKKRKAKTPIVTTYHKVPTPSKFNKIIQDIRTVKIQGATNVAKAGIRAFLIKPTKIAAKHILKARPTEPLLQNAISYLLKAKSTTDRKKRAAKFLRQIKDSQDIIAKKGANLIKTNTNIYTHCHSSTVINILKYAKRKRKKKFIVYTTEVEPLLQGRMTARDLAKAGIKTIVFPDMAAEQAMKKCDLFLFGADAFTKRGLANKIGTSTLCKLAKHFHIPAFSCSTSLKLIKRPNKLKLESRPSREVWQDNNKKIDVINPAFDFVKKDLVKGVISELGILTFRQFVKQSKKNLKKFS